MPDYAATVLSSVICSEGHDAKTFSSGRHCRAFAQLPFAVDSKKVEYMGGTWVQFEQGTEGKLDVSNEAKALFFPKKGESC
jgi:hypothetical protein